jgi:hypothetical protein
VETRCRRCYFLCGGFSRRGPEAAAVPKRQAHGILGGQVVDRVLADVAVGCRAGGHTLGPVQAGLCRLRWPSIPSARLDGINSATGAFSAGT